MEKENKRPKAVVGVMLFKDGKVLIGKRKDTASHGAGEYSFPGGHIEHEESFKEAIERETKEEAGIDIKNLKFLCVANVDNIKNFQGVLIGFTANLKGGEIRSLPEENIGEWQWLDINNLPEPLFYPTAVLIDSYKSGKNYYDKE